MAKVKQGDKVKITKNVAVDPEGKFLLEVGEVFTANSVSPTGVITSEKQFSNGVLKRFALSKGYYQKQ